MKAKILGTISILAILSMASLIPPVYGEKADRSALGTKILPTIAALPDARLAEEAYPPSVHSEYLIALPLLPPDSAAIPPGLSPEQAAEYAHNLTDRQARPLLAQLERLRAGGDIAGFEVRPDLHAIVVTGTTGRALEELARRPEVAAVMPYAADKPPACAIATAQALSEQVLGLSRMADTLAASQTAALSPQTTDPSINLYVPPGGTSTTWTYIWGQTTASIPVYLRILRGGRVIATQSTTSSSYGYYSFYPSWLGCYDLGYNWSLRPGDVVEVTAHDSTVSTVVADLRAWVDPETNIVAGRTEPGRSVEVNVCYPQSDPCLYWPCQSQITPTDGNGNFSADFSGLTDFDRRARAIIYAHDANGNSTYYYFYAYRLLAYFEDNDFWGYLKPEVDFTATLSRTGSIVATRSGRASAAGYYYGWFTQTIQPGDAVQVDGGGVSIHYIATGLDVTLDSAQDAAVGTTSAGRLVRVDFYKSTGDWIVSTSCSWSRECRSAVADGSGAFFITTTLDLVRGDGAYLYLYDAEGNCQYGRRPVPAIVADLTWNEVLGYWGDPTVGSITVTLKDSGGTVKETVPGVWVSSWAGRFNTWLWWSTIIPSDIIEATDGEVTETMTVQSLSARLDGGSGHLAGGAYDGHLLAELSDFRRDQTYWYGYCSETEVTGGAYDLTFGEAQVGGQDEAQVWNTGPDGHYTSRYAYAFAVNLVKEDDHVWGYAETPSTPVTVTLERGGNPIAVYTATSGSEGYYEGRLGSDIAQGDTVQVQTGDGDSVALLIPELTANADAVGNRVYGRSPASEPVRPEVRQYSRWGLEDSYSQITTADDAGDYSASFGGLYWWDCSPIDLGHRCAQVAACYYDPAGHGIWVEGPYPPPVGPDIYESDNISTTASPYTGIQSHTFHTITDTDWVTFTVPQADVDDGVPYRIETLNLGSGMDTYLYLYDTDGVTELAHDDDSGSGLASLIVWTPPASGTYYVEVRPFGSSAAYCDAVYDLMILPMRGRIFLPLVLRGH